MSIFSIGADPELLLSTGNRFKSAIGVIPGSKDKPFDIGIGSIHPDNVTAEFNTLPANCKKGFNKSICDMMEAIKTFLTPHCLCISRSSFAIYEDDQLEHPGAKEAGCEPDFNAYQGGSVNPAPPLDRMPIRSAGGHIHIGVDLKTEEELLKLVKTLDLLISVPAMKHESLDRKILYGKAGSFRCKPYGVEYRTPSNWWVFTEERRNWIYDRVAQAVDCFKDVYLPDNLQSVIDEHDLVEAHEIVKQYNIVRCPD